MRWPWQVNLDWHPLDLRMYDQLLLGESSFEHEKVHCRKHRSLLSMDILSIRSSVNCKGRMESDISGGGPMLA